MPFYLYFHLPFCRRKCPYCDFFKKVPLAGERQRFLYALLSEIELATQLRPFSGSSAATVYFGGGTPSLHSAHEIEQVLTTVRSKWGILESAEITLEANPGTLDAAKLSALRQIGVNRLSMGVQSFSSRKLEMLFRDHSVADVYESVALAREAGFKNISLDLIFGLPGETEAEWIGDIEAALSLKPEHVSLYNLEYHEGTPFYRWRDSGRFIPLQEDAEADLYLLTHQILTDAGFEHYEVSNFAKPGYRAVHNSAYWESKPYLGLGPSAHSFDGDELRFWNVSDLHSYFSEIEAGRLPIAGENHRSTRDQWEEWIALALRRSDGIDFETAAAQWGEIPIRQLWKRAEALPVNSRSLTANRLSLTAEGWFRENSILLWLFDESIAPPN